MKSRPNYIKFLWYGFGIVNKINEIFFSASQYVMLMILEQV